MTRPKALSELSPGMQRGLVRCHSLVVEVADERHCGIAPRTLAALLRHGLIEQATDKRLRRVYRPTPRGAELLRQEEPLYLSRQGGKHPYTREERFALHEERVINEHGHRRLHPVEAVPLPVLAEYAADAAERRRGEPGRRREELDRRIRNLAFRARAAAKAGDEEALSALHAELDGLERQVEAMERARQDRAA